MEMYPFEREIYLNLYIKSEKERQKALEEGAKK